MSFPCDVRCCVVHTKRNVTVNGIVFVKIRSGCVTSRFYFLRHTSSSACSELTNVVLVRGTAKNRVQRVKTTDKSRRLSFDRKTNIQRWRRDATGPGGAEWAAKHGLKKYYIMKIQISKTLGSASHNDTRRRRWRGVARWGGEERKKSLNALFVRTYVCFSCRTPLYAFRARA